MKQLPLVLHIGYHKTGTTFLQNNVFSKHKEIVYLGHPFINTDIKNAIREFKFQHDINFDSSDFKNKIYKELEKFPANSFNDKKIIMISLESLHSGEEWFGRNIVTMSYRLKNTFPDAKIILGIRSQAKYIESNYKEYIIHGGKMNFDYFLFESFLCNKCLFPKLQYDKVITLYRNLFHDNFSFYIHEKLVLDMKTEIRNILNFLGINENLEYTDDKVYVGLTKMSAELIRYINKLTTKDFIEQYYDVGASSRFSILERFRRKEVRLIRMVELFFMKIFKFKFSYLKDKHIKYIKDTFSESNKHFAQLLDQDIKKLGFWY